MLLLSPHRFGTDDKSASCPLHSIWIMGVILFSTSLRGVYVMLCGTIVPSRSVWNLCFSNILWRQHILFCQLEHISVWAYNVRSERYFKWTKIFNKCNDKFIIIILKVLEIQLKYKSKRYGKWIGIVLLIIGVYLGFHFDQMHCSWCSHSLAHVLWHPIHPWTI